MSEGIEQSTDDNNKIGCGTVTINQPVGIGEG